MIPVFLWQGKHWTFDSSHLSPERAKERKDQLTHQGRTAEVFKDKSEDFWRVYVVTKRKKALHPALIRRR